MYHTTHCRRLSRFPNTTQAPCRPLHLRRQAPAHTAIKTPLKQYTCFPPQSPPITQLLQILISLGNFGILPPPIHPHHLCRTSGCTRYSLIKDIFNPQENLVCKRNP